MPNGRDLLNVNFVYLLCSSTAHPQGNKRHRSCNYKPTSNWFRTFLPCREWCSRLPATQKSQSQLKKSGMQEIPSSAQGGFLSPNSKQCCELIAESSALEQSPLLPMIMMQLVL